MRISPLSSALAVAPANTANATVKTCRESLIISVPLRQNLAARVSRARPLQEVAAGVVEFGLHAFHQFGNRRCIRDLSDALAGTPDVAPRLDLHVAAGAEIH